ncbi:MAG: HAD family phosphatase [Burkholderiales bacterium]|nr:MAG: HAD family phosphatase [Burkholderiales bacterium]
MTPLEHWPVAERARIRGVLTDIDDTLTTGGALAPEARQALLRLRDAGLPVFALTGRPAGWSAPLALDWPLEAIVAENGAVALWREPDGRLGKDWLQDEQARRANARHLQAVARQVLARVPGARLAEDSPGRETDIAIDHSEFHHLDRQQISAVVRVMEEAGLRATVSSIHINGWIGDHDKLAGARWILHRQMGISLDAELAHWVYIGDSTNDAVMFAHCLHSVGVANIARFAAELTHAPRHVTRLERGAGFAELAHALLAAR